MQQTQPALNVASPLLRIGAFLIDTITTSLIGFAILSVIGDTSSLRDPNGVDRNTITVLIITSAIYTIGFNAAISSTPGKIALGMYVADVNGARIRPDTSILRYIIFLVGHTFFFGTLISFVLLFTNPARRTLHDRIAGTMVLRRQQGVDAPPPDLS
jgi:uncharacterized RDD family membrane protein YckC